MKTEHFPILDPASIGPTRNALHAYARVLGDCLKRCRSKRKHWWHASLRPSLSGLSTGVVHSGCDFELTLNFNESVLCAQTESGASVTERLEGQAASELATLIAGFLLENGIDEKLVSVSDPQQVSSASYPGYSRHQAAAMGRAINGVSAALASLRAGIREECSPIQLWPHHFDLSMLWLPGDKVSGQDPADEEAADKQMNFGFAFGDDANSEPYFYVTAYPLPDDMHRLSLPAGTIWRTQGFSGAFLAYEKLLSTDDPHEYLLSLWNGLLVAGRELMMDQNIQE
jgi:hypothetical protein